ncbi:MAG: hypothetical protein AAFN94_00400 [Pseudomonadota bacterium]
MRPGLVGAILWAVLSTVLAGLTPALAREPLFPNSVASNDLDFIRPGDADAYLCLRYEGRARVEMPDKRNDDLFADDTYVFRTGYRDGAEIPIWVHRDIGSRAAAETYVAKAGAAIGQLPSYMRKTLTRVIIHAGNETAFAEDRGHFFVLYAGNMDTRLGNNDLEETVFHESVHATLDLRILQDAGWQRAQRDDPGFVTQYAARLPGKEDLAESALFAWTMIHHPGRLPADVTRAVRAIMPARLAYLEREFAGRNTLDAAAGFCDG